MKIREAKLKDVPNIEEIFVPGVKEELKLQLSGKRLKEALENIKKFKKIRLKGFEKYIKSKLSYVIVAEDKKEIIGFGKAIVEKNRRKFGATPMLYVKKEFRRRSVASKIKKELLKWLKSKKVKYVNTEMFIKNKPSINLNKKFGFKIIAVRMQKELK